jgi:hypothetical protein
MRLFSLLSLMTATLVFCGGNAQAGPESKDSATPASSAMDLFHTGALELQVLSGPMISFQPTHAARPNIDYSLTVVRLGYMLDTPRGSGFFRGNDEVLLEASGAAIFQGPGSAMGGLSALYRRNFVQPNACLIPYFGIGLGGLYTDIYHNPTQRALGSAWEFNLAAELGARVRIGKGPWTVDIAATYRHISDASLTERNDGIDAIGGMLGFSRFF